MDPRLSEFEESILTSSSDEYFDLKNEFIFKDESVDLSFMDNHFSPRGEEEEESMSSDPVFKYISQMLMEEEDMDAKPWMLHDSLALHATEKSLYEALHPLDNPENNNDHIVVSSQNYSNDDYSSSSSSTSPHSLSKNYKPGSFQLSEDIFSKFNKGVEEATQFLPKPATTNLIYTFVKLEEKQLSPNRLSLTKGRKRGDMDLMKERLNKQSAVYVDDDEEELSELFDTVLLACKVKPKPKPEPYQGIPIPVHDHLQNVQSARGKKQESKLDLQVDLRTLLILCAQAVSADDRRTANELLNQIRQHSSPLGDGTQRLAHCFANGLEARLSGTGTQIYTALASKRRSAADILKAYYLYIQACPFKKVSMGFANQMIMKAAEKAKTLHIIDFGILYGFQWMILIHHLSTREGGPPKLRVTGIDLPQSGLRPAERVEETGRRLAKYCKRSDVPFEYNGIAQKWDTIQVEDLKIDAENEVVAVNCLYRFKNLLDETVLTNCNPRNAVLNLIRSIKPNIFTNSVVNGSYNAPFFVTRFREAFFQYSALFDMFDTIIPRDNPERLMYEREFCGREVMNVVACEGSERVERPETYKQWQVRHTRAGFGQVPLDREVMGKLKDKCKDWYHKDFLVDEDGGWVLIGWKGRILYASSCWYPA